VEHSSELTADGLWSDVSARLREALNDATFRACRERYAAIESRLAGERALRAQPAAAAS